MKRVDERDLMFSRMGYQQGTAAYIDYYQTQPEKQLVDDELRAMPQLCSEETPTYDPLLSEAVNANFNLLADIRHLAEGGTAPAKTPMEPERATRLIKSLAIHYGALDVKCCYAKDEFYYTYRGRHPQNYGEPVDTSLKNTIVFSVSMDPEVINTAPQESACVETSYGYVKAAMAGLQIAYFLRGHGYQARCHMDANYLMMMTPLAVHAGLGQIGRHGLLIGEKGGSSIRLGAVTTDLPLVYDQPSKSAVQRFCQVCGRCVKTCPAKTISDSDLETDWTIEQEACYRVWRNIGTDCGICISACPIGQEITIDDIRGMNDKAIADYLIRYQERYGPRNYQKDPYFPVKIDI